MSTEHNCPTCGNRIGYDLYNPTVRVIETRGVVTRYDDGGPVASEAVATFAGVYCSRSCAAAALTADPAT